MTGLIGVGFAEVGNSVGREIHAQHLTASERINARPCWIVAGHFHIVIRIQQEATHEACLLAGERPVGDRAARFTGIETVEHRHLIQVVVTSPEVDDRAALWKT